MLDPNRAPQKVDVLGPEREQFANAHAEPGLCVDHRAVARRHRFGQRAHLAHSHRDDTLVLGARQRDPDDRRGRDSAIEHRGVIDRGEQSDRPAHGAGGEAGSGQPGYPRLDV